MASTYRTSVNDIVAFSDYDVDAPKGLQAETATELDALPPSPRLRRTGLTSILDKAFNSESVRESQANCDGFAQPLWSVWLNTAHILLSCC